MTTMESAEKRPPSSICLQHVWKFTSTKDTLFLTEFIGIPEIPIEKAYRLGAETNSDGALVKVCCYVDRVELTRFGFAPREVTCTLQEQGSSNATLHSLNVDSMEENTSVLFLSARGRWVYKLPSLTFRLYFSGSVKQYSPSRFDVHLGEQLWDAAVNGQLTDVVFQVGNSTFPVHKFILAARSPVFRAMFDADMVESRTGKVQITDADPEIFGQFLRFLYTGQLAMPLSKQLEMVAEKYQVETLAAISRASAAIELLDDDGFNLVTSHWNLKRLESNTAFCLQSADENNPTKVELLHTEVYTASKDVVNQCLDSNAAPNLAPFIRFKCRTERNGGYAVTFYSSWRNALALKVAAVALVVVHDSDKRVLSENSMEPLIPPEHCDKQPLQVFRAGVCYLKNYALRFVVHFVSTVDAYLLRMRDSLFPEELWSSAIHQEWTDVEFQVGGKIFSAHRALLAARCPALAALVPAQSSPSSSSTVSILDMDPIVFEDVLYFLYTGSVREHGKTLDRKHQQRLSDAARIYQIETLSSVTEQKVDQDKLSAVIMAIL